MAVPICTLDVETRSTVDLRKTGPYPYSEHPSTDTWCVCWAIGDGPVHTWVPGDPAPVGIADHLAAGGWIEAHNVGFEHAIWTNILVPRYGWPEVPLDQWSDTMIRACVMGLPRSLEDAAIVLRMPVQKDKQGHSLMMRMAKPRKPRQDEDPDALLWWDDQERVQRLISYCEQDVITQRELGNRLRPLTDTERDWFLSTLRANARGIRIDHEFVTRALKVVERVKQQHKAEIARLTNHAVTSPTQVAQIKAWLSDQGFHLDTLDKNHVAELIETGQLPESVRPVLDIRAQGGKSSVSKLPAFQHHVCRDGRIRGEFVHHGAGRTGRDAGSGVQLQNLPSRGGLPWHEAHEVMGIIMQEPPEEAIELIDMLYAPTPTALSSCLRSVLRSSDGKQLFCADYSNIEGRVAAWLAGETWKLDAFQQFDDGTGPDLYKIAAGGILGTAPEDVSPDMRNSVGKVSELALQFQGGVGAFLSMAKNYRVEIGDYWDVIRNAVEPSVIDRTQEAWQTRGFKSDTDQTTWVAAEAVKVAWRDRHPAIVQAWYDCEAAAIAAIRQPGTAQMVCDGRIGFSYRKINGTPFLMQRLPSGRLLYIAYPTVKMQATPWGGQKASVHYWGVHPTSKKWSRQTTYGGDLFQSCLAIGTPVLTSDGWKPIEEITSADRVWDGESWVLSSGAVCNGTKPVIDISGVLLTADHEVLTYEGWKTASQSEGHHRAQSRLPKGIEVRWQRWSEIPLVGSLRLRNRAENGRQRTGKDEAARSRRLLRLPARGNDWQKADHPRNVTSPGASRLGFNDRSMLPTVRSGVEKLWRTGHHCLRTVANVFREFLGRHGADLPARAVSGSGGQQRQLLCGKLPLGGSANPKQQPAPDQVHSRRPGQRDGRKDGYFKLYPSLPPGSRLARGQTAPETGLSTQVFDILNCGPRNRFVVRDGRGQPLIVHNCVQGSARDIMMHGWANAEERGYDMLLRVHDEIAGEHENGDLAEFEQLMCDLPEWAAGMPVTAEGYVADRYRKG